MSGASASTATTERRLTASFLVAVLPENLSQELGHFAAGLILLSLLT